MWLVFGAVNGQLTLRLPNGSGTRQAAVASWCCSAVPYSIYRLLPRPVGQAIDPVTDEGYIRFKIAGTVISNA